MRTEDALAVADVMLQLGDAGEAERRLRDVVAAPPAPARAHALLAHALMMQQRVPEAVDVCERALALHADDAACLTALAEALFARGDLPASERALRRALAVGGPDALRLATLGAVVDHAGRAPEARALYEQAVLDEAGDAAPTALRNLAENFAQAGDRVAALAVYESFLDRFPSALACTGYAQILLRTGRLREGWQQHEFRWFKEPYRSARPRLGGPRGADGPGGQDGPAADGAGLRRHVPVRPLRADAEGARGDGRAVGAGRHAAPRARVRGRRRDRRAARAAPAVRLLRAAHEPAARVRDRARHDSRVRVLRARGRRACRGVGKPDWRRHGPQRGSRLGREPAASQRPVSLGGAVVARALGGRGGRPLALPAEGAAVGRSGGRVECAAAGGSRARVDRLCRNRGGDRATGCRDLRRHVGRASRRRAGAARVGDAARARRLAMARGPRRHAVVPVDAPVPATGAGRLGRGDRPRAGGTRRGRARWRRRNADAGGRARRPANAAAGATPLPDAFPGTAGASARSRKRGTAC